MATVLDLGRNLALLLALIFVYSLLKPYTLRLPRLLRPLATGVIFGGFGLIVMSQPIPISRVSVLDGRSIVLAIGTLLGGIIPGAVAGSIMLVYRSLGGNPGAPLLWGSIITTIVLTYGVRQAFASHARSLDPRLLLLLGLLIGGQLVVWLAAAPVVGFPPIAGEAVVAVMAFVPGGIVIVGLVVRYVERQTALADELRTSEERYRSVIGAMTEGVVVRYTDVPGITLNNAAQRMFGPVADHIARLKSLPPEWQIINEDGTLRPVDRTPSQVALRTGQPLFNDILGLLRPDGHTIWLSSNAQPIFKEGSSQPYGAVSITTDITQERLNRQQLAQERNQLRTLIDNITDYIFIKDVEGRYVISNRAHAHSANSSREEMVGKTTEEVFPPDLARGFVEHDRAVLESGQPLLNVEQPSLSADGKLITVLTTKIPLIDESGKVVGLIGIARDITDRLQLEQHTRQMDAEQGRMELLQQFINDVTHDFKTPLTILNTSVYLLKKTDDPIRQQEQIEKLETQITRLTRLFDDFVSITNLDSEVFPSEMHPQHINEIVEAVIEIKRPLAHHRQHTLTFDADTQLAPINGNSIMLRHAVDNILTNAIHYTPDGGVIHVRTYAQEEQVIVEVQDNGIGIGPQDLPHIFERLYRVDPARSTSTGGTGLGLSIAQKIVEAHGGTITVESAPGQGSTFQIHLPRDPAAESA